MAWSRFFRAPFLVTTASDRRLSLRERTLPSRSERRLSGALPMFAAVDLMKHGQRLESVVTINGKNHPKSARSHGRKVLITGGSRFAPFAYGPNDQTLPTTTISRCEHTRNASAVIGLRRHNVRSAITF